MPNGRARSRRQHGDDSQKEELRQKPRMDTNGREEKKANRGLTRIDADIE
jgi:hypothetical protein